MNPLVESNLALVLFLPWFVILGGLFWIYPRQPRDGRRRLFDAVSLVVAVVAFVLSLQWAHGIADRQYGEMWPQVLATSLGHGVFLAVITLAWFLRRRWLRNRRD